MLIVKKFGGTSVANKERIFNVARRCIEDYKKGNDVVVVLSAMGKYTDELITMAKDINDKPPKREMDMLFTIGEQMSVALMSMAMDSLGVPAVSLNAFQVAMHTTSAHGSARLKKIDAARIRRELDNRRIVVVTGFQGIDKYNDYTTLGRGGSDTTAVAIAAALHADACEIYTDVDGVYTADPRKVSNARKLKEITYDEMLDLATLGAGVLHNRRIVVVTGFQGIDKYNDYTTLGRGGSDTTAVAIAAALHADACEIYTDVDGVYTADPRKVSNARKLKEITYDEMLDLATLGAGVLHNRSVEMAKKYGVPLVVRSSLNNSEGTVVKEEVTVERMLISGVALDTDAVRIAVIGLKDSPGVAFKLFDTLAKKNINVDMILQSIGRAGTKDISFTVDKNDLDDAMDVLEANQARIAYSELHAEKNIAKLSIVGAGMMSNPGVAAKMFESLYNEGVNINMIATSEIRVTVLINEKDGVRAMNAVHDAFNLAD
nr:aspartate kinase [uncultured Blautia sp.]